MLFSVRSLVVVALTSVVIGAGASAGSAATGGNNPPIATVPAVGSRIFEEPSSVTLAMRSAVTGPAVVTVTDSSGHVVSEGSTTLLSTNIAVDLKTGLAHGVYTVSYRIEGGTAKGPEGGTFQFAYGSGSPKWKIATWSGYKNIPKATRLPGDAKREAAFEAAANGKGTPTPTATSTASATGQTSGDPTKASDETGTGGHAWVWVVVIALALVGGGAAAYVASRRRAQAVGGKHAGAGVSPPSDET